MKVKELIDLLLTSNQEDEIFFVGYEGGLESVINLKRSRIIKDIHNKDWMGPHEEFHKTRIIDENRIIDGVILIGEKNRLL